MIRQSTAGCPIEALGHDEKFIGATCAFGWKFDENTGTQVLVFLLLERL
jgi:hypothetical protein